jgi:hypothetical protein
MKDYYLALLHYPVYNRRREIVTTSVANMDIHDIARIARTYGIRRFYIITPILAQRVLVRKILDHWLTGYGAKFNPLRKEAFEIVSLGATLADSLEEMAALSGRMPKIVITGAALAGEVFSCPALKECMNRDEGPFLFLFGTGWGLADEVVARGDYRLAPIQGATDYNHLAVRSAVAIVVDRLLAKG